MTLPSLTPEKRAALDALASQQSNEGTARLLQAYQSLDQARHSGDEAAKQQAVGSMHEALGELEAGIAARRVLSEGKAPRNLALDWFKREMNLASPVAREEPHTHLGLSPLHLFTMALLIAFGAAMVAMSFFRMRRAAALFGRLEPSDKSPPPGSSPPISGGPKGDPPADKPPESGPPPAAKPPEGGAPPAADKPSEDKTKTAAAEPAKDATTTPPPPPEAPAPSTAMRPAIVGAPAPLKAKWKGLLQVESIVRETPLVKTFRLRSQDKGPLPITYDPGQFLNVAFAVGGARMNRSYSISSSPTARDFVEFTVKREERGAVSRHILDLIKVGDAIEAGGPVGKFTFTGTEADSIVLISGGVGITPMMSITRYLTERSWVGDIYFIYACRSPADFIFKTSLEDLERRNHKLHVVVTMSDAGPEWTGLRGRITADLLTRSVPDLASRRVHVCGPPAMMDATKALLTSLGVTADNLKSEQFGAVKPPIGVPGPTAKSTAPATGPLVTFSKSNKSAKIGLDQSGEQAALATGPGQTILELSEELGIGIEFSCRVGTCGVCKVKMTAGDVDMAVEDALDDDDKNDKIILACQAKPKEEVTVEA